MNLEDLNTQQTVMLAVLVAFVTALATSIVVVRFLAIDEHSSAATSTVNQVVTQTIERVVPSRSQNDNQSEQPDGSADDTDEVNALSNARIIEVGTQAVARLMQNSAFFSSGVLVSTAAGEVIVSATGTQDEGDFSALFENGDEFSIGVTRPLGYATIFEKEDSAEITEADGLLPSFPTVDQSVLVLIVDQQPRVLEARVSSLSTENQPATFALADIAAGDLQPGSIVLSQSADVLGIVATVNGTPAIVALEAIIAN